MELPLAGQSYCPQYTHWKVHFLCTTAANDTLPGGNSGAEGVHVAIHFRCFSIAWFVAEATTNS